MSRTSSIVLHNAMASKTDRGQQFYAALYIMIWLFISKIVFFDLIVAVLVENFEVAETVNLISKPGRLSSFRRFLKASYRKMASLNSLRGNRRRKVHIEHELPVQNFQHKTVNHTLNGHADDMNTLTYYELLLRAMMSTNRNPDISNPENQIPTLSSELEDRSLFIFGKANKIRMACLKIQRNKIFQCLIYIAICLSCILLIATPPAEDVPMMHSSVPLAFRNLLNKLLTIVFAIEFVVAVIAQVVKSQ